MHAIAELERAAVFGGARLQVGDVLAHLVHRVGPHQVHVARLGGAFARLMAEAAEIEGGAFAGQCGDARRVELEVVKIALEIERLAVEQGADDLHDLGRAGIAGAGFDLLARHVGRDDVDVQPSAGARCIGAENAVERRDPARELRRPVLAHARCPEQLDAAHLRRDGRGERGGVEPERIARR